VLTSPMPTVSISRAKIDSAAQSTKPSPPEGPELASGALFGLRVLSSGEIISLVGRENFTLGRAVKGQAVVPDVDLETREAYDMGVSRLHAEIRLRDNGIFLADLESVNGTLVNGEKVEPTLPATLRHGDILQLGRMRLQLITRQRT
jgi:pSer/pThr/pTyr-binding forkhead associated (FHA) protein